MGLSREMTGSEMFAVFFNKIQRRWQQHFRRSLGKLVMARKLVLNWSSAQAKILAVPCSGDNVRVTWQSSDGIRKLKTLLQVRTSFPKDMLDRESIYKS